jgi:hypothetical protein
VGSALTTVVPDPWTPGDVPGLTEHVERSPQRDRADVVVGEQVRLGRQALPDRELAGADARPEVFERRLVQHHVLLDSVH